ncbi:type III pantothenate kinase [Kangiella sp. HD9-110m-PIT-SAG06]|nr:type III pantothenate kinase [Kangiella sp. HD9-110m-PIT-SAG06]
MFLLMDQGNSRCKYLLTSSLGKLQVVDSGVWDNEDFEEKVWHKHLGSFKQKGVKRVLVSSVAGNDRKQWFQQLCQEALEIKPQFAESAEMYVSQKLRKLRNSYATPQALGVDRWLAMIAAFERSEGSFVVIDAGTAITTDWVDAQGWHKGGHIVASGHLLQRILLVDTGGIAWSASHDGDLKGEVFGENTSAAVATGAECMLKGYCFQMVRQLAAKSEETGMTLYITGGDAEVMSDWLKEATDELELSFEIDCQPELVLEGLSHWFSMNN